MTAPDVRILRVERKPPRSWRKPVGLLLLLIGFLATGLALLLLQGGSVFGLIPGVPGLALLYGGRRLLKGESQRGELVCEAALTGSSLRIDGHDFYLNEDFFVVLGYGHFMAAATFIQGGESKTIAWASYGELKRPAEGRAETSRRLREAWGFEAERDSLRFHAPGNLPAALLKALHDHGEHDRLEILRAALAARSFDAPNPSHEKIEEIPHGHPGHSMPYRGGALTPEAGQRFLDDFRDAAHQLVSGVHVGADYVVVRHETASTVIPIGPVAAHADGRVLVVAEGSEPSSRKIEMPDPASAELVAQLLRRSAG